MNGSKLASLLVAVVTLLLFVGCSNDGEEARVGGGDDTSLGDLVSKLDGAEYWVSYDSTSADGSNGVLTVAVSGEKTYVSMDFAGGTGQAGLSGILIEDGANSYSCDGLANLFGLFGGASSDSNVCYRSDTTKENDMPSLRDFFNPAALAQALAGAQTGSDGNESIAGREARCFKIEGVEAISSGRICVEDSIGVPLLIEGVDDEGARFSQHARELRDEVDDSVFEPPYEMKDYPELSPDQ
jgi:hypothetical protein